MSFSSARRRSLSAAGSKVVREQLQLVTERPEIDIGRVGGHVSEASARRIAAVPNIKNPEFDDVREQPGFRARRAKVGRHGGAVKTGLSYWEVDPGEAAYPYHAHLTEEEIIVVTEGRPSLRTPDGWRELEEGEVVVFSTGERGAHQIVNNTDETIRFLAFSNSGSPEIVIQLDAGKVGAFERPVEGTGISLWFREADAVEYFDGVERTDA
jgi:uncharacterized cupin superfamily protein